MGLLACWLVAICDEDCYRQVAAFIGVLRKPCAQELQLVLPVSLTASRTPRETALAAVNVNVVASKSCVA